ncbi:MAG: BTAD domain-containing putative transcriptional regulator, partial [Candidatus Limnocylindria bacterium]
MKERASRKRYGKAGPCLNVRLLGSPTIDRDGEAVAVDTRKAIALLVLLAVGGREEPRARLAAMLWPEADDERARGALRRTLSALRSSAAGDWISGDAHAIRMREEGLRVDVADFRRAVADGRLAEAAELYRGDFLAGFGLRDSPEFDDWQAAQADELRGLLAGALSRLARQSAAAGDLAKAIEHARRRLAIDPLDESAHRELMRLHASAGDPGAALRQYRECERILDAELGVKPVSETHDLYEAIRTGRLDDETGRPTVDEAIGDVYTLHGAYAKAVGSYEAALAVAPPAARPLIEHKLAEVHHRRGDWERAERHYRAASASGPDARRARALADWSLAAHRHG